METDSSDDLIHSQDNPTSWDAPVNAARHYNAGYGVATAHHGELFQGVLTGPDGRLRRGLVSLPCSIFKSEANFSPDLSGVVRVNPAWKVKAQKAAKLALDFLGEEQLGGELLMSSDIPVGWGLGSSTSDVTAAIRAVADACRKQIEPKTLARLAVTAETASDTVMFDDNAVLFAQREGVVIEDFHCNFPCLEVLGFNTDPTGHGLDTLSHVPARYSWWEIEAFRPVVGLLRRALETQSPYLVGQVATASAHINQQHLPKPHYEQLRHLVTRVGALGLQVAHSGTVVGLLFDPGDDDEGRRIRDAQGLIEEMGFVQTWRFKTGANGIRVKVERS